jgi:hypothetical protein
MGPIALKDSDREVERLCTVVDSGNLMLNLGLTASRLGIKWVFAFALPVPLTSPGFVRASNGS